MPAMPILLAVLCVMAIAYRYYSAFLAAKVAALDDARPTPAVLLEDGQNFDPTHKWVLFGHHFAAISGAGPLIGPVLAAQFGYLPGLLWIVIGVCLGGAVQDFLVLAASIRRGGKSLAQIAYAEVGKTAGVAATAAILFIIIIALAGLGKVVVKALGGEKVNYEGSILLFPPATPAWTKVHRGDNGQTIYDVPAGASLEVGGRQMPLHDPFQLSSSAPLMLENARATLTHGTVRLVPGSAWGAFTIACTIPIALFVGLYMYRIRKGKVIEASLMGGALTLAATFAGGFIRGSPLEHWFDLQANTVMLSMAVYGFFAAVLPVWVLLLPRDYLSSFLKIGTVALLVIGTLIANPHLSAPAVNHVFLGGGPIVAGKVFPFLFITIMCGAISGFHALVSSGTTPKMISRESHARTIGYGAMLIEGLVAVVAMIAACAIPTSDFYAMNTELGKMPQFYDRILLVSGGGGIEHVGDYEARTQEALRGRTGGAVTLAVGMAEIFDKAFHGIGRLWKYWYHFAIMFEALFILTTIDAGTRIGRFLLQEVAGRIHPQLGRTDWWPGALISTLLIVVGWAYFINANSFGAIWVMFGIANQMLAVIALAIVSVVIVNAGKARYLWVSVCPLLVVMTTTSTAAIEILVSMIQTVRTQWTQSVPDRPLVTNNLISAALTLFMLACTYVILIAAARRIWPKLTGEARI